MIQILGFPLEEAKSYFPLNSKISIVFSISGSKNKFLTIVKKNSSVKNKVEVYFILKRSSSYFPRCVFFIIPFVQFLNFSISKFL